MSDHPPTTQPKKNDDGLECAESLGGAHAKQKKKRLQRRQIYVRHFGWGSSSTRCFKRLSLLIALSLRGMNDLHLGENVASYVTRGA